MEKTVFSPLVINNEAQGGGNSVQVFSSIYQEYLGLRNIARKSEGDLLKDFFVVKANLAFAVMQMYLQSPGPDDLRSSLRQIFDTNPKLQEEALDFGIEDPYLAAYSSSFGGELIPSPIESIEATLRNLEIVEEFVELASPLVDSMILSGANAWGPFYAVKGGVPDILVEKGIEQIDYKDYSDIDLLVVSESINDFEKYIQACVTQGLIPSSELNRYEKYKELYQKGKVDIFSMRLFYRGVEESFHFIPSEVIDKICAQEQVNKPKDNIDYVRDFRPNKAKNVVTHTGYPTKDLRGKNEILFQPITEEIRNVDDCIVGYISETTIGGPASISNEQTYFIGVISFFLLIAPAVLFDKEERLSTNIKNLKEKVKKNIAGEKVVYIPRQERMPTNTWQRIARDLS